jgi:putative transposase
MFKTYELRIRPNLAQRGAFEYVLRDSAETYNAGLQERKEAWKLQRKNITLYEQFSELTELRKDERFAKIAVDIQREPLRRLDRAFKAFFRRVKAGQKPGFPRFRARARYDSFLFNLPRILENKIKVPNLGWFKFKSSQPITGTTRTATVKRLGKKWIVRLVCDIGPAPEKRAVSNAVGIDVGLTNFVTLSDGTTIENPRWIRKHEARIAAANRKLALKQKRSKNRIRAREVLRRAHQRAASARRNFTHHVSKWLVSNYDLIAFEKLNIKNMSRSATGTIEKPGKNVAQKSGLNRSILDAAWGELIWQLKYKAEYAGVWAVPVNPRGTSIRCSGCGEPVPKTLADRQHICGACGLALDRDHNAARNILRLGEALRGASPSKYTEAIAG